MGVLTFLLVLFLAVVLFTVPCTALSRNDPEVDSKLHGCSYPYCMTWIKLSASMATQPGGPGYITVLWWLTELIITGLIRYYWRQHKKYVVYLAYLRIRHHVSARDSYSAWALLKVAHNIKYCSVQVSYSSQFILVEKASAWNGIVS